MKKTFVLGLLLLISGPAFCTQEATTQDVISRIQEKHTESCVWCGKIDKTENIAFHAVDTELLKPLDINEILYVIEQADPNCPFRVLRMLSKIFEIFRFDTQVRDVYQLPVHRGECYLELLKSLQEKVK